MSESAATTQDLPEPRQLTRILLRRLSIYLALIYVVFLLLLFSIELLTRFTMKPVSSLDLRIYSTKNAGGRSGAVWNL